MKALALVAIITTNLALLPRSAPAGLLVGDIKIPESITAGLDSKTKGALDQWVKTLATQVDKLGENLVAASQSIDPLAIRQLYNDNKTLHGLNAALERDLKAAQDSKPEREYILEVGASDSDTILDAWVGSRDQAQAQWLLQGVRVDANQKPYTKQFRISITELGPGRHELFFRADRPNSDFRYARFSLFRPDNPQGAVHESEFHRLNGGANSNIPKDGIKSHTIWLTYAPSITE